MDAADVALLERFMDVPYVLEAPASKPEKAIPALTALARIGGRLDVDESKGIAPARYKEIVDEIRGQVATQVPPAVGYRIDVLDISAKDLSGELNRISEKLKKGAGDVIRTYDRISGAFSFNAADKKGAVCIAVGYKHGTDIDGLASQLTRVRDVKMQDLTKERYHQITLWHEVGHCLLGPDEAKADTFGALMAVRFTDISKKGLSVYAGIREMTEWTTSIVDDNHVMSKPLWAVAARMDALRQDKRFMSMGMEEIAELTQSFVAKEGPKPDEIRHVMRFRAAFREAATAKVHWAKAEGGVKPVPFFKWMQAGAKSIPEIARLLDLQKMLKDGTEPVTSPVTTGSYDLKVTLAALKEQGDPTAGRMLKGLAQKTPTIVDTSEMWAKINPLRFDAAKFADMVVPFDPKKQRIAFSHDQERFAVSDGTRVVASGTSAGMTGTVPATEVDLDEAAPVGMRR